MKINPLMKYSKMDKLAYFSNRLGITRFLEVLPRKGCLICLNYHRIGNPDHIETDPGIFSASQEQFHEQILFLNKKFKIISLEEAIDFIYKQIFYGPTRILLTFDDGYLDNYQNAFPVLKNHNVAGTFFLTTSFVGTNYLPWWDLIASILFHSKKQSFILSYPAPIHINMELDGYKKCLRILLAAYKSQACDNQEKFIGQLREMCEVNELKSMTERVFLSWAEAREMRSAGMYIGSHSNKHGLLGKMSSEIQREELSSSKEIIEKNIGERVEAFAYPVGGKTDFSEDTFVILRECGYKIAFSFYGGVNYSGKIFPYDIRRMPVDYGLPIETLRLRLITAVHSGARYYHNDGR
jgi:peptidoglycan/xylan/chitin deacetylase (PgdA/CDA1 family)